MISGFSLNSGIWPCQPTCPFLQNIGAVGNIQGKVRILLRKQDGQPFFFQGQDLFFNGWLPEGLNLPRVRPTAEGGDCPSGSGQWSASAVPRRKGSLPIVYPWSSEWETTGELFYCPTSGLFPFWAFFNGDFQIFTNGEIREDNAIFGDQSHPRRAISKGCFPLISFPSSLFSGTRGGKTHDTPKGGRFANAVSTQKAHGFPLINLQREVEKDMAQPIKGVDLLLPPGASCSFFLLNIFFEPHRCFLLPPACR